MVSYFFNEEREMAEKDYEQLFLSSDFISGFVILHILLSWK